MATLVWKLILGYINGYIHDALSLGAMNDLTFRKHCHRYRHVARHHHVVNVWFVIGRSRKSAGHCEASATRKPLRHRHAVFAHQHFVVRADAVCNGIRSEYLLSGTKHGGGAAIVQPFSLAKALTWTKNCYGKNCAVLWRPYLCHLFAPAETRCAADALPSLR